MDKLLLVLTSKRMTTVSVLLAVLLFLADGETATLLQQALGLTDMAALKVTSFAKLTVSILAAAGYSPLKRPDAGG